MIGDSIITVQSLRKLFPAQKSGGLRAQERYVHAVDGVDFELAPGEILALVGESGCGKSTLALTLLGLEKPTSGQITIEDQDVSSFDLRQWREMRRHIQMIFQDPYESLNPLMKIQEIVEEPLIVHRLAANKTERQIRVQQALEGAGLKPPEAFLDRLPHELSGGQRQRVVIASALVLEPRVLIADEPVSMLDVSIRAEVLNLLVELRDQRGISILYITHDLGTVAYLADRIAVMYLGRIVEIGETLKVLSNPLHPYTKALLSVVPVPNPRLRRTRIILQGETPNSIDLPGGCRFHPRCPIAVDHCKVDDPEWREIQPGYWVACHEVQLPAEEQEIT